MTSYESQGAQHLLEIAGNEVEELKYSVKYKPVKHLYVLEEFEFDQNSWHHVGYLKCLDWWKPETAAQRFMANKPVNLRLYGDFEAVSLELADLYIPDFKDIAVFIMEALNDYLQFLAIRDHTNVQIMVKEIDKS